MKPILFAENSTVFTSNGIGRLSDAVSCYVSEERNGFYELEMVYPATGIHYADIAIRSIIVVHPYAGASLQAFRVYQITKPISGKVVVRAQHISYDLSKNTAMPFTVASSSSACNNALQGLKNNAVEDCPFTFWTNVTTLAGYSQAVPASIRSRLGGVEGSVLDQFHGEYEWDNFTVKLHNQRGADNGVVLRYGKNITDIKQDENIANTITGVVPFWSTFDKTETVVLPEKVVYAPNAGAYSSKLTVPLDFSSDWQEAPTVEQLRAAAQAYINSHELGVPAVSIDVSFVNLADTEEYKGEMAMLQTVKLCDTITVQFESLGISVKAKIVKYEWDVLKEKYKSLEVGSIRSSLATTLNEQNSELKNEIIRAGQSAAESTSWLTQFGGYVVAIKDNDGNWEAIAFSDNPDPYDNSAQVLLINQNGMGFSSHGLNGPFYSAWTLDGHLTLGGKNNEYGTLKLMGPDPNNPNNMVQIGKWDKDGISATKGSFSGSINGSSINGSTVNGSEFNWGSGGNTAKMYWNPTVGSGRGALYIEANDNAGYPDQITIKADILYILAALWTDHDLHVGYVNHDASLYVNGNVHLNSDRTVNASQIWEDSGSGLIQYWFTPSGYPSEYVNFYIYGGSANVLSHGDTGNYVKWSTPSDVRSKENIEDLNVDFPREFFKSIRPVSFNFKKDKTKKTHFGLIAQELEEILENLGQDNTDLIGEVENEEKTKYIDYPGLIGICLSAIKDLYKRVEELEEVARRNKCQ